MMAKTKLFWRFQSWCSSVLMTSILLNFSPPVLAALETRRLDGDSNSPIPVDYFSQSPDGRWLIYSMNNALYRLPAGSVESVRLGPPLPSGDCLEYSYPSSGIIISPDSRYVVYSVNHNSMQLKTCDLYSVAIEEGITVKLTDTPIPQDTLPCTMRISPDSKFVIYSRKNLSNPAAQQNCLMSVPITGGPNKALSQYSYNSTSFQITPDSQHVVLSWENPSSRLRELHAIPITGGVSTILASQDGSLSGLNLDFTLSGDGKRVIYHYGSSSFTEPARDLNLYCVPITGGSSIVLDQATGVNPFSQLKISPDGSEVFYNRVYKTVTSSITVRIPIAHGVFEEYQQTVYLDYFDLYRAPISGGTPRRINLPLSDETSVRCFEFSPDGNSLLYIARHQADSFEAIYKISMSEGTPTRLSRALLDSQRVDRFIFTPDSGQCIYRILQNDDQTTEPNDSQKRVIYDRVPLAGGTPILLFDSIKSSFFNYQSMFQVSPDGSRLVFFLYPTSPMDPAVPSGLLSVPLTGGDPVILNPPGPSGSINAATWFFSSDGVKVFYLDNHELFQSSQLYSVLSTGGVSTCINSIINDRCDVSDFKVSPDGQTVIYRANQDNSKLVELYSVPATGGPIIKLSSLFASGSAAGDDYQITPDSRHVILRARTSLASTTELYSVPVHGGTPVRMHEPLEADHSIQSFQLTPDGTHVVFAQRNLTDVYANNSTDYFSVPVAGGSTVLLHHAANVQEKFIFSPDSQRIFFGLNTSSLISIPVEGGPAIHFDETFPFTESNLFFSLDNSSFYYFSPVSNASDRWIYRVTLAGGSKTSMILPKAPSDSHGSAQFAAKSATIVYSTENYQGTHATAALYSIPFGAQDPVRLDPLPSSGEVNHLILDFKISPDQETVFFSSFEDYSHPAEFFVAPLKGGQPVGLPITDLAANAYECRFLPGNSALLFKSDHLFTVSLLGGFSGLRWALSGYAGRLDDVARVTSDGRNVAFLDDPDHDGIFTIFSSPTDKTSLVLISGQPTALPGIQKDFWVSPDAKLAIYRASMDTNGVHLFASRFNNASDPQNWQQYP